MKILASLLLCLVTMVKACYANQELGSWNETISKEKIISFVEAVTDPQSTDFVPAARRIAVFDNDGTLWLEKPLYPQLLFAMDRIKELASQHPNWKATQPFKAVLENDLEALQKTGKKGVMELIMASHGGMTVEEFNALARNWLATAKAPRFNRYYHELVYQPMVELLDYLRANGFKTFIISGGGVDFMRIFAEEIYGIVPEQVIGTSLKMEYAVVNGKPQLYRLPELFHYDDKEGKPVAIQTFIGRRPILAFGNSDGDLQMLQWTAAGKGKSLCGLIHHTDQEREYAYDRQSHVGRLETALAEAREKGWLLVDMQRDWNQIFISITP